MKQAARQSRGGIVAKCAGMRLTPTVDRFGPFGSNGRYGVNFRCNVDCTADDQARTRVRQEGRRADLTGRALGGVYSVIRLPRLKLVRGAYKFNVAFYAPLNPGATVLKSTRAFSVR